jgi:hypothetical protein
LVITNFVDPLFEAVKRSPEPELFTTIAAKVVAPETEATASVGELARISTEANGVVDALKMMLPVPPGSNAKN